MSALRTGRLYPKKCSWYSFLLEAESTPGPQCDRKDFISMKFPITPAGIEPATFRFVAQHLNHCVTAVPQTTGETNKKSKVTSAFRLKRTRLEVTWLLYVPPDCYRILRSTILRKSFIFSCFPYYIISRIRNENWQIFTSSFLKFRVTISSTSSDR